MITCNYLGKKSVPGPGQYETLLGMNKTGSYFISKFMSSMCRTHYHSERNTMLGKKTNVNSPGPGNYRLPSDFGYYEAKKKFGDAPSATTVHMSRMAKS